MSGIRAMPALAVGDVAAAAALLVEGLGFSAVGFWRDEDGAANFGVLRLGQATLALRREAGAAPMQGWAAYIWVEDIDALAAMALAQGVTLTAGPEDAPYAAREIEIALPEGQKLRFAQDLAPGPEGPGL